MRWIDRFTLGSFQLFAGNVLEGLQPIDFYHFFPMWYDVWLERIARVITVGEFHKKSYLELKTILPPPSNLRVLLQKIITSYQSFIRRDVDSIKLVTDFIARMLIEACPNDPFAINKNFLHTQDQVNSIFTNTSFVNANPAMAKKIGRLITAAGSLVHGLYNDVVTDFGWEAFGPYSNFSSSTRSSMLIRWFPNMQPKELWPTNYLPTSKEIYIYSVYDDVDWKISFIGCHTIPISGNPVIGMSKFAVVVDGKCLNEEEIDKLIEELSVRAEYIYKQIRQMDFEQLKVKVMLQECYQLKKLFDAIGLDWRPTAEMLKRVTNQPLLMGIIPHGKMVSTMEEFIELFGVKKFAQEVLGEHL